ncbi:MAG TPA: heme-binding protein, partial [Salinarimonas sp.]|nr:heme-binding protein [Salinarimonas sp.]
MPDLNLKAAQKIVAAAIKEARERGFKPLAVAVYDARGALKAFGAEDGTSLKRGE